MRPSGIVVSMPTGYPAKDALAFVDSKQSWIAGAVERNKKRAAPPKVILPPFSTRLHKLTMTPHTINKYTIHITGGEIRIGYPEGTDHAHEPLQRIVKKGVEEAYRIEARKMLPERVRVLAKEWGFSYMNVSFRNSISRWGSCSGSNSITLSLHLMTLPDHLIDYVILHELCHTVHKDHAAGFHALLDKVTQGRHKKLLAELKGFTTRW